MTAAQNMAIVPRTDTPFTFLTGRRNTPFYPGAGTTLHFASRETDTATLTGLPRGMIAMGQWAEVRYRGVQVFRGMCTSIAESDGKGTEGTDTVTLEGPWGRMARLVYRQEWRAGGATFSSGRVVLNRSAPGNVPLSLRAQLTEVVRWARRACTYQAGDMSAIPDTLYLPADETRDITVADAVRRLLRFHPKVVTRFAYSSGAWPMLVMDVPPAGDAAWTATAKVLARARTRTAEAVRAVDVSPDATDIILAGGENVNAHQVYPPGADVSGLDVLHVTVPLAPGRAATSTETFDCVTEDFPADLRSAAWWKEKHPRLANVALSTITIETAVRDPARYPRIAKAAKDELRRAGLHCEVSRCTAKCKISTPDDEEEELLLTMDFLTTDAETRRYTWQTGSIWEEGETLPAGLAQALYEQHSGELVSERLVIRLGEALPTLGDRLDGLVLQSFDVDCTDLTATCNFGRPAHLSVDDLRGLLSGFRQRGYAETAVLRGAENEEEEEEEPDTGIPPLSATEFAPGKKTRTTIKTTGGKIKLDAGAVAHACPDGEIGVRTINFKDYTGTEYVAHYLGCRDLNINLPEAISHGGSGGGGSGGTALVLTPGDGIKILKNGTEVNSTGEGGTYSVKAVYV